MAALCQRVYVAGSIAARVQISSFFFMQTREIRNKHHDPKWRKARYDKVIRFELPNYETIRDELAGRLDPDEQRSRLKKEGIAPTRPWLEKPMTMTCTEAIMEPYVPPEGDGRASLISKEGAKQLGERGKHKTLNLHHIRKIRGPLPDFEVNEAADHAQTVFIKAHEALAAGDEETLHDCVTEICYPDMTHGMKTTTTIWKWHGTVEPPRIVQIRTKSLMQKTNLYAQLTLRLHSRQTLAIYDRFGRLIHGSDSVVKDVIDYAVFEKPLADVWSKWRLHAKIHPEWAPRPAPVRQTFRKPVLQKPSEQWQKEQSDKQKIPDDKEDDDTQTPPEDEEPQSRPFFRRSMHNFKNTIKSVRLNRRGVIA